MNYYPDKIESFEEIKEKLVDNIQNNKIFSSSVLNKLKKILFAFEEYKKDNTHATPEKVFSDLIDQLAYCAFERSILFFGNEEKRNEIFERRNWVFSQSFFEEVSGIIVTGSFGVYELVPVLFLLKGLPVKIVTKFENRKIKTIKEKFFSSISKEDVFVDLASGYIFDKIYGFEKNGYFVFVQCDQIYSLNWKKDEMKFLGKKIEVPEYNLNKLFYISTKRLSLDPSRKPNYLCRHIRVDDFKTCFKFLEADIIRIPEQWYLWKEFKFQEKK